MPDRSRVTNLLLLALVLAGLVVAVRAVPPLPAAPIISPQSGEVTVTSPGTIDGCASTTPPDQVTVRAYIDGVELEGSPDVTMQGGVNQFHFAIPPDKSGHTLVIKATSRVGMTSTESHVIQ
jgi:hypothetical protein